MAREVITPQLRVETAASQPGNQLGERLRRLRKQTGWTLQELSRHSGVSLSTLSKIENSQVAPTFDTLVKAARGLGIGFEALLAEPAPTEPPPVISRPAAGRLMVTRAGRSCGKRSVIAGSSHTLTLPANARTAGSRTASQLKLANALLPLTMRVATANGTENLAASVLWGVWLSSSAAWL